MSEGGRGEVARALEGKLSGDEGGGVTEDPACHPGGMEGPGGEEGKSEYEVNHPSKGFILLKLGN